jgi:hypothetical protein
VKSVALVALILLFPASGRGDTDERLESYLRVIREHGQEPARFVIEKLKSYDLLVFDDGLHTAVEPFEFLQRLLRDDEFRKLRPTLFLEVIPVNKQRHLDAYLAAAEDDQQLLFPAFQDDANGRGFPYQTYFDLLRVARAVNQALPPAERFAVRGVGSPTFWAEIQTPADWRQFGKSMLSYDHHMYAVITDELAQFRAGKKGIFVANTRHAYKGIRRKDGQFYWNATTFLSQRHPGKCFSVRLHNVQLSIRAAKPASKDGGASLEGRDRIDYKFVRMAHGLWDAAFRANGDKPVAIPLADNVFGREPYLGNHQLDAAPRQTMADAYDALIFLAPLEKLRQTALTDVIYTPAFRAELKRRYRILYTETQLTELLKANEAKDLDELIAKSFQPRAERLSPESQALGPADEWKTLPRPRNPR